MPEESGQAAAPAAPSSLMGAGAATPAPAQTAAPAAFELYSKEGKINESFVGSIPEKFSGARSFFSKYNSAEKLGEGLEALQHFAGQKALARPDDTAPQHVKDAFNAQLRKLSGVPDSVEGYAYKGDNLPEGFVFRKEDYAAFADGALKAGYNSAQVDYAMNTLQGFMQKLDGEHKQAQAKQMEENVASVRKEFGDRMPAVVAAAKAVALQAGLTEEDLANPAIGSNPSLIRAFYAMSQRFGESSFVQAKSPSGTASLQEEMKNLSRQSVEAARAGNNTKVAEINARQMQIAKELSRTRG